MHLLLLKSSLFTEKYTIQAYSPIAENFGVSKKKFGSPISGEHCFHGIQQGVMNFVRNNLTLETSYLFNINNGDVTSVFRSNLQSGYHFTGCYGSRRNIVPIIVGVVCGVVGLVIIVIIIICIYRRRQIKINNEMSESSDFTSSMEKIERVSPTKSTDGK